MGERAYKRMLQHIAEQPGGETGLFPLNVPFSPRLRNLCLKRGLIEQLRPLGGFGLIKYRITDAGRAEIADNG